MDPVARARARARRDRTGRALSIDPQPTGTAPPARGRGRHRAPAGSGARAARALWTLGVPLLLLALGVWTRVFQWRAERSLWLDEALIARSLVSRGYVELVAEPLLGEQAAPVVWLWASRSALDLLGEDERGLRFVPLVGGVVALALAWALARRLLPAGLVPVAVALVVLSPSLLYYANEVKPYSVDVAVVLGVLLLALRVRAGAARTAPVAVLAAVGAVAVWTSFASVFALAGVSVVLVLDALRAGGVRRAARTALVLSGWVVSLGVAYATVLHRLSGSEVLSAFWAGTFPGGTADLPAWGLRRAVALVDDPLELALAPLALLLLAVGTVRLLRDRPRPALLALAGVPVAGVAAAVSAYPFASRLALWTVPLAAVVLAAALPHRGRPAVLLGAVAALAAVAGPAAAGSLRATTEVQLVEEIRPVMERVAAERRPDDLVLVDIPAKGPFDFYTRTTGLGRDGVVLFASPDDVGGRCNDENALRAGRFATQRVWVVFAHPLTDTARLGTRDDLVSRIEDVTNVADVLEEEGAKAVLFDPSAPESGPLDEPRNPDRCLAVVRTVPPTGR